MSNAFSTQFVFATLVDGTEVFGVDAFPFRRDRLAAVAFDVHGERQVLSELEATIYLLDPEINERLPSRTLWQQANTDDVLRRAIKERCGL